MADEVVVEWWNGLVVVDDGGPGWGGGAIPNLQFIATHVAAIAMR